MEEEKKETSAAPESGHEPHAHAGRRIVIALIAVTLLVVGGIVWALWGEEIKEACTGNNGACAVELPVEPTPPPRVDNGSTNPIFE